MLSKGQIENIKKFAQSCADTGNDRSAGQVNAHILLELITMLETAQKDAARYQWLRSENTGPSMIEMVSDDCNPPSITLKCEEELDAAIDAAMQRDCGGTH